MVTPCTPLSLPPLSLPQSPKQPPSFQLVCVSSYSELKSSLCSGVLIPAPPAEWRSQFKSHSIPMNSNDGHEHLCVFSVPICHVFPTDLTLGSAGHWQMSSTSLGVWRIFQVQPLPKHFYQDTYSLFLWSILSFCITSFPPRCLAQMACW